MMRLFTLVFLIVSGLLLQIQTATAATYYFVRHAESTSNAGTAEPGDVDPTLTELGFQQADVLVDRLAGVDVTTIYVSSYQRMALTAAPTAEALDLAPITVPDIREWSYGETSNTDDMESIYEQIAVMSQEWLAGNTAAGIEGRPSSESLDDLKARVLPAYQAIIEDHADEEGVVVIVAHGASIGWVMPFLADNVTLPFTLAHGLSNSSIVKVKLTDDQRILVTEWEGIPFIENGPAKSQ